MDGDKRRFGFWNPPPPPPTPQEDAHGRVASSRKAPLGRARIGLRNNGF